MQTVPMTFGCDACNGRFRLDRKLFQGHLDVRIRCRETALFHGRER